MRIFLYELKKIWNPKVLLIIAVFAALTWFAFLNGGIRLYERLSQYGIYGSYQTEMFRLYGDTLEPEELEDYDIPKMIADAHAELERIMAAGTVFAKHGITNLDEYYDWINTLWGQYPPRTDIYKTDEDLIAMQVALNGIETLDEWQRNPEQRLIILGTLKNRYVYHYILEEFIRQDTHPVAVRSAERILAVRNSNLVNDYLMPEFSKYAAVTGIFALVAVMVLVTPLLIVDRSQKVNFLQYSSAVGRKILRTQFIASIVSAFTLSVIVTVLSFNPFIAIANEYWNVSIMSSGQDFMWLYNITFGQYVYILAVIILALCIGAACFAFILARFSTNVINVMIKTVPVGVVLAALLDVSVFVALSNNNTVFNKVFVGRFDMPEVVTCGAIGAIGVLVATPVVRREKRIDML